MLVLARKNGESIRIGDDVVIKVAQICGNRVKIAIDAPKEVRIKRSELEDRGTELPAIQTGPVLQATTSYRATA